MKKVTSLIKENKFAFFTTIIVGIVITLSLGTAAITKTLQMIGNTTIKENSWIIYFDDVQVAGDSVEASKEAKIVDYAKTKIEFETHLKKPGDFYEFTVYAVNDGTLDATIRDVRKSVLTEAQEKYLDFIVTYADGTPIQVCDRLDAGTRRKIIVRVVYKEDVEINDYPTKTENLKFNFEIDYIQEDTTCPSVDLPDKNVLVIDPNGGKYKTRPVSTEIYLEKEQEYKFEENPVRDNYNFLGWEVVRPEENGTYELTDEKFVMGEEDVTIRAKWEEGDYVARIEDKYYPTIQQALDDCQKSKWTDNTIHLLRSTTEYPINNTPDQVKFDLEGYTVTGTFTNSKVGNIQIVNGIFKAEEPTEENKHEQAIINYGTLTMGDLDGRMDIENSITILGNDIGLQNVKGSKFYMYDGYIEGVAGLVGGYTGKATGYHVFVDHRNDTNNQRVYLLSNPNRAVARTETLGEMYYYNMNDAITTAEMNKRKDSELTDADFIVYTTRDFEAAYDIDIDEDSRIYLDLKGFVVDTGEKVINNGYLKIYSDAYIKATLKPSISIDNKGTLDIEDTLVKVTTDTNTINNSGNLNLKNTTVEGTTKYGVHNGNNSKLTLDSDSVIKADSNYGLHNTSNIKLSTGTIQGIFNEGIIELEKDINVTGKTYGNNQIIHNN